MLAATALLLLSVVSIKVVGAAGLSSSAFSCYSCSFASSSPMLASSESAALLCEPQLVICGGRAGPIATGVGL